jgi:hypothetical protein
MAKGAIWVRHVRLRVRLYGSSKASGKLLLPTGLTRFIIGNSFEGSLAQLPAMFPKIRLDFVLIQAIRNLAQIHEDDAASRHESAFAEDLYAAVRIKPQGYDGTHQEQAFLADPKSILQSTDSSSDCFDL